MQFFKDTHIDFIGKRKFFGTFSAILCGVLIAAVAILGIDWGIDFVGGTECQFEFSKPMEVNQIRKVIEKSAFSDAEIKSYGRDGQFIIRVRELKDEGGSTNTKASEQLLQILEDGFSDNTVTKLGENSIGPKVGGEMRTQAVIAVFLAVLAMLIYVAFRFEFVFGAGAVIALIHDVIFAVGVTVLVGKTDLLNLEFTQSLLAAALTVVGYSVNDTVVIFDRIRENKELHKEMALPELLNLSLNETLSRTIMTTASTLLVLIVMVFAAGPVLEGFAFMMLAGLVSGTYSTIYIASAFVVWYDGKFGKKKQVAASATNM